MKVTPRRAPRMSKGSTRVVLRVKAAGAAFFFAWQTCLQTAHTPAAQGRGKANISDVRRSRSTKMPPGKVSCPGRMDARGPVKNEALDYAPIVERSLAGSSFAPEPSPVVWTFGFWVVIHE